MEQKDIRWLQRFSNFNKAFDQLEKAVEKKTYNDLERQGLIKAFEFTYELAWNTLKDFLYYNGYTDLIGSKDTIRLAFKVGLIKAGTEWMEMLKARNLTSHTYNRDTADAIEEAIKNTYYALFKSLQEKLEAEKEREQTDSLNDTEMI
jgi:nucleotidyltransferase substrate binding protein (TIGR01987 family)